MRADARSKTVLSLRARRDATRPDLAKSQQPPRPSRHGRMRAEGGAFRTGNAVKESGIYEVIHKSEHRASHEVVMLSGDVFPNCETCGEQVRFQLVRTAPYIFQDEDFEESK